MEKPKNRIKELLEAHGLSQVRGAGIAGVTQSTFGSYCQWKSNPKPLVADKLAKYFNVSVSYLLGVSDDPSPDPTESGARQPRTMAENIRLNADGHRRWALSADDPELKARIIKLAELMELEADALERGDTAEFQRLRFESSLVGIEINQLEDH